MVNTLALSNLSSQTTPGENTHKKKNLLIEISTHSLNRWVHRYEILHRGSEVFKNSTCKGVKTG